MRALLVLALTLAGAAHAEELPAVTVRKPAPGLTLGAGRWNVTLTVETSVSRDRVLGPVSLAPDVAYGATPRLTLAIIHSGVGITGFRGAAGAGICLRGAGDGCPQTYRNVGFEGLYALASGELAAALNVGLHLQPVTDPTAARLKLGARTKLTAGRFAVTFSPSLYLAANARDRQKDSLWLPLALSVKPSSFLTAGLGTGVKIPDLAGAGDSWHVPVGIFAQAQLDPRLAAGASFVFGNVAGADLSNPGLDSRFAQVWLSYTR